MLRRMNNRTLILAAGAALVLILILLFAFSSCGGEKEEVTPSADVVSIEPTPEPTPTIVYETVYIGTAVDVDSTLNIRAEPSTSGTVLGKARNGDKFTVLEMNVDGGDWHKISYEGVVAYASSKYMVVDAVQREVQPTAIPDTTLPEPEPDADDPEAPGLTDNNG